MRTNSKCRAKSETGLSEAIVEDIEGGAGEIGLYISEAADMLCNSAQNPIKWDLALVI